MAFQSTPSVWRETRSALHREDRYHISIHSLRVEGDGTDALIYSGNFISIHSLRVEGDAICKLV